MTMTIRSRNVNSVFPIGIMLLRERGHLRESRNGPTLEIMEPVSVTYDNPDERVLFDETRDSNPFFTLFESLWMLAGRNDVAFLDQYNKGMSQYSDDGVYFNAAYGYRLRHHFGFDQLDEVIQRLRKDPDDRRAVLQLMDVRDVVAGRDSRDHACNVVITPRIRHGKLDWTVFNRSNDYVFGMTGANVVHMSIIQEYVASMIGIKVGSYSQISNCLHAYTENPVWKRVKDLSVACHDPYRMGEVKPHKLVSSPDVWDKELKEWMDCPWSGRTYTDPFFEHVAKPMAVAHKAHKDNKDGLKYVSQIQASDWRKVCTEWLARREEK